VAGVLISLEGGDGTGKSTQALLLYRRLLEALPAAPEGEPRVLLLREPGGTDFGDLVYQLVQRSGLLRRIYRHWRPHGQPLELTPRAELLLFSAARAQLVAEVMIPRLTAGAVILCDRFVDSTIAYQGHGRGLPLHVVEEANTLATQGVTPDLTLLLDLDARAALARKRGVTRLRLEREELAFHERVRRGYLELARQEPERWRVFDASKPPERVHAEVWSAVGDWWRQQPGLPPLDAR
jgi:dTMP kinase